MMGRYTRIIVLVCAIFLVGGLLGASVQGFLVVHAIDGVQILVDGELADITVEGTSVLMLEPRTYSITLKKEGYTSTTHILSIRAGESSHIKVDLERQRVRETNLSDDKTVILGQKTGAVEIRSVPLIGASIRVHGTNYGLTDKRLSNLPIGQTLIEVTYNEKKVVGIFTIQENRTILLQANYALDPPQLIQLYDATFVIPELPMGFKAELSGDYGKWFIVSDQKIRVMGPKHTVKYTNGTEYIDFVQDINLEESTYVQLHAPEPALFMDILPSYTIKFDTQGGAPIAPVENIIHGTILPEQQPSYKEGYIFDGWYKDSGYSIKWNFGKDLVFSDMTLHAKWGQQICNSSIALTYVEGGTFQMGSHDKECTKPIHAVTLESFYIGTYEITQDIYEEVTGTNPSYFIGAHLPVETVSWYDAVAFANALSKRDGLEEVYTINEELVICDLSKIGYRLPTEAEWEYASKGGKQSQGYTYAGSDTAGEVAWYRDNSKRNTNPVGSKIPNELGLHDMSGNVWEWCWDRYEEYSAETNPADPPIGYGRILRGGSWGSNATYVSVASSVSLTPSNQHNLIGFRLVLPVKIDETHTKMEPPHIKMSATPICIPKPILHARFCVITEIE